MLGNVIEEMRSLTPAEVASLYPEGEAIDVEAKALRALSVIPNYGGFVVGDSVLEIELTARWTAYDERVRSLTFESAL